MVSLQIPDEPFLIGTSERTGTEGIYYASRCSNCCVATKILLRRDVARKCSFAAIADIGAEWARLPVNGKADGGSSPLLNQGLCLLHVVGGYQDAHVATYTAVM